MTPEPCHWPDCKQNCRRAGVPMAGRLLELCRGINCSVEDSERYRALWDGFPIPAPPQNAVKSPCKYLGEETGERTACSSCAGSVWIKTLACTVHGECTVAKKVPGKKSCADCDDWEA